MRLRFVPLVLALLLSTTVVVPVLHLAEDDAAAATAVAPAHPLNPSRVTAVSWQPRVFVYKGFLSDAECDHLVTLAKEEAMVAHNRSGSKRTSTGMFLKKRQHAVVSRIEERIAAWTFLPEEKAEDLQIQRYEHGQKYDPHMDQGLYYWLNPQHRRSPRYATVIMHLSTVDKGGETVFPKAKDGSPSPKMTLFLCVHRKDWQVISHLGLVYFPLKPVKGDAVLFFSLHADGAPDPLSLHRSCPVIQGEKWSAPKWIRVRSHENPPVVVPKDAPTVPKELQNL